jgi:hypothetical protein
VSNLSPLFRHVAFQLVAKGAASPAVVQDNQLG